MKLSLPGRLFLLATLVVGDLSARADDYTWLSNAPTNASWSLSTNWSPTSPAGGPSGTGTSVLLSPSVNQARIINLFDTGDAGSATKTVGQLDIGNTTNAQTVTLASGTGGTGVLNFSVSSGTAQLNVLSGALGNVTISAPITLSSSLNATNAGAHTLTLSGSISGANNLALNAGSSGAISVSGGLNNGGTVTNSGAGSGATTISATIGSNVTSLIQNSVSSTLSITGAGNSYGSLVIKAGTVFLNSDTAAAGTGTIILGDAATGLDATLNGQASSVSYANAITVASGSGARTIGRVSGGNASFSGLITLNNNLIVNDLAAAAQTLSLSGGVTGTGNITITDNGGGAIGLNGTGGAINNAGTITNSGTGSGQVNLTAGIGTAVTAVTQASDSSAMQIGGQAFTLGSDVTLTSNGAALFTVSSTVTGAHNLTFAANRTGNFTVSSASLNNGGTITNSGTGSGVTTISGIIGSSVTGLTENSATSNLVLSGSNSYAGVTNVSAGTLLVSNPNGVGTSAVHISGGVFQVNTGTNASIGNAVTMTTSAGSYVLNRAAGQNYNVYAASSNLGGGGRNTTAMLRDGVASSAAVLTTSFALNPGTSASNDASRISDVFTLNGSGAATTDTYVMQLSISGTLSATDLLSSLSGGAWVNAVNGNTSGTATFVSGTYDSSADFHLGWYGVDASTGEAWAVLDYTNASFAVIGAVPEPAVPALLGIGFGLVWWRARRRRS